MFEFIHKSDFLINHIEKSGEQEITSLKLGTESHLYWKDHFHRNPIYFKIIGEFEADIEIDNFSIRNKTNNIYKQNPIPNEYYIISESSNVLKSG